MRYILNEKISLDSGEELITGDQILLLFVTPKVGIDGKQGGSDYEQQRKVRKVIRYLRSGDVNANKKTTTEKTCQVPLDSYIELEDAQYEWLIDQAKNWRWGANDGGIADMIESWIEAPDIKPIETLNG